MIEVYAPRYHDRTVLLAGWKVARNAPTKVRIKYGAYKGEYEVPWTKVYHSPTAQIKSKQGKLLDMFAVSLDDLERIGDLEEKE